MPTYRSGALSGFALMAAGLALASHAAAQAPLSLTGKQLYESYCARCHGADGSGGLGPDLRVPRFYRAPDDLSLLTIINFGIEGTDMPAANGLALDDIRKIAIYVKSLGRALPARASGNVLLGEQLYRDKGKCAACHMIDGKGGSQGPELTGIGRRRSLHFLRTSITDPEQHVPDNYLLVGVVTREGRTVRGIRMGEDTFTIRILDANNRLLSFHKSELKELHKDWGKSAMPSYKGVFTEKELEDLVAYLASRVGAP